MKTTSTLTAFELNKLLKFKIKELLMHFMFSVLIFAAIVLIPIRVGVPALSLAIIMTISYMSVFILSNRRYFTELLTRKKKVYEGLVVNKRPSSRSSSNIGYLEVSGKVFRVYEETMNRFELGEKIEIHYSSATKMIFSIYRK